MTAQPLALGVTYYWQVSAWDPYGGISTAPWQSFVPNLANQPPYPVAYASTPATLATRATDYLLSWQAAGDPDGDAVSYLLELGSSSQALTQVQLSSATSYRLPLQYAATVYWRVSALDGLGGISAGAVQNFLPTFLNQPPQSPNVVAPFKDSPVVKTMKNSVTVSWEQVSDPQGDPITYTVYFGSTLGDLSPLAIVAQPGQGDASALSLRPTQLQPQAEVRTNGNTVVLSLTGLDYYQSYYIRVAASNPYGATSATQVQSFTLASADGFPSAYNYPNPFSPQQGGTNIVFNAPSSGYGKATVEIYSEWQDLLFKQDYFNIPAGISQVHFDGRDRNGRPLFNGSYACRVRFSSPDGKQTFHMLVVK